MKYYVAINTGLGFITYQDTETSYIGGYPGDVWATDNVAWANRVGGVEKTKAEAQAIVDAAIAGQVYPNEPGSPDSGKPVIVILP